MGRQIETLRAQGHDVTVLSFIASAFDQKLADDLRGDQRYDFVKLHPMSRLLHAALAPWLPACFAARTSLRFACKLLYHIRHDRIEAIHAEYAVMGQYQWILRFAPHLRFIMTEHDVTLQSYERKCRQQRGPLLWFFRWQTWRVRVCEARYLRRAERVLTFSEKDKDLLLSYYGLRKVFVLHPYFGIEDADIEKGEKARREAVLHRAVGAGDSSLEKVGNRDGNESRSRSTFDVQKEPSEICFLGQMGRRENADAAARLIRLCAKLREEGLQLHLSIIGNAPPEALCAAARAAGSFVEVTGFVEDVDAWLVRAKLAVFPLTEGAGIKLKVLRSMALGVPVITTAIGAEGIDEGGEVLCLAETDEDFLRKMHALLALEQPAYEALCQRSRRYVRRNFAWGQSETVLAELYAEK